MQVKWTKLLRLQLKSIFVLTWGLVSLSGCPILLLAQSDELASNSSEEIQIPLPKVNTDPPDRGTPPASEGTGSRGACLYKRDMPPLTRLGGSNHLNLTVNEYPSFWVYVPYTAQEAPDGEFSLQDGDDEVYRIRFQLPETPGIVSITQPSTAPPLEVGKKYRWYFKINCPLSASSNHSPTPASLTGLVQRIASSSVLDNELKVASTPLERIATYARHGIWYETLTGLAQLRLNEPQNSSHKKTWIELLSNENVGLEKIAQEPIVGRVKANSLPE